MILQIVDVEVRWLKDRRLIVLGRFAVAVRVLDLKEPAQIPLSLQSLSEKPQKCP